MADNQTNEPGVCRRPPRVRLVRVLVIGVLGGIAIGMPAAFYSFTRNPDFQEIRGAWLAERPLVEQLRTKGARFNEIIWWCPENGESFPFACAYKYYRQVQHIRFSKPDVSAVPFSRLKELKHLESIDLSGTNIRADQIAQFSNKEWTQIDLCRTKITIEGLRNLEMTNHPQNLSLAGSTVTDEMLGPISDSMIIVLSLEDTKVTDTGMVSIAMMRQLQNLSLAGTKVGDEGLRLLSQHRFFELNLSGTAVTDKGLTNILATSPGTRLAVNLSNTRISDAGMSEFKRLKFVEALNLANTQVTDTGLENLKDQRYLRWLCIGGTKVTSAGVESLLKARKQQKDEWKIDYSQYRSVEPPDLVIVREARTEPPGAYPISRY
jgi:hypothetical protein